jgi:hypothetical protein
MRMGFLRKARPARTRYLVEVPHDPAECGWVMDEIVGRGPQYAQMFWWGCKVDDHRAWAWLEASGREDALEETLPPVLRARALVHRLAYVDGPGLRDWHDAHDGRRR